MSDHSFDALSSGPKRRVVIESPLSGDFERNKRYAIWAGYHCYTLGEAAYASHLFYPQFLDDTDPAHREFGIEAGYLWAQFADAFVFYTDFGYSGGMTRAKERWSVNKIEERTLPPVMLAQLKRGLLPNRTPGFEEQR
jgi:hypothetical protein